METLEAIKTRRSIRKFTGETIPEGLITKILEAAMYAPSGRDTEPWHFIVVTEKEILHKIPRIHPHANMVFDAPLAILVCGDTTLEHITAYNAINCAASTQNLMLAAHDLGLGAVWLGVYPRKERMDPISQLFELPSNIFSVSLIALGYPAETVDAPDRFKKTRIHYNKW